MSIDGIVKGDVGEEWAGGIVCVETTQVIIVSPIPKTSTVLTKNLSISQDGTKRLERSQELTPRDKDFTDPFCVSV